MASDEIVLFPRLKRDEFGYKELIVRRGDRISILFDYFLKNFKLEGLLLCLRFQFLTEFFQVMTGICEK